MFRQQQLLRILLTGYHMIALRQLVVAKPTGDTIDLSGMHKSIYGEPDLSLGKYFEKIYGESKVNAFFINPEEKGSYLEGDLLIPVNMTLKRMDTYIEPKATTWPSGIIPYIINSEFTAEELKIIILAMSEFHSKTCIRFRKRQSEKDYIKITGKSAGCFSSVGRAGGVQIVNFAKPYCLYKVGTIIHEFMHVLGFQHEQSRYIRDDYVKIHFDNIEPKMTFNFDKTSRKINPALGLDYDYASLMHYGRYSLAIDTEKPTMTPLKETPDAQKMGQRHGFSPKDMKKINTKYKCNMQENEFSLVFNFKSENMALDLEYDGDVFDYIP